MSVNLSLKRIVLFTPDLPRLTAFYCDVLGLPLAVDEPNFKEFAAGGCGIALHRGASRIGARPPKLSFWTEDIAATRDVLIARGAKLGEVKGGADLMLCEGKDPDGNPFQLSSRL
jgi:catechol 2,3-dioxygenase-like lactoylglutathione lyase family enzyme